MKVGMDKEERKDKRKIMMYEGRGNGKNKNAE